MPAVLQIGNRWFPEAPGGLERYHYELARHLPGAGFDVLSLVIAKAPHMDDGAGEVRAFAAPSEPMAKRLLRLRHAVRGSLRSRGVALIACHYPLYGLPVIDVMKELPTIFHFHGPWAAEGQIEGNGVPAWLSKRFIEHLLYRRPAGFVVLSSAFAKILHESYGVPAERILVIPGGVDFHRFCGNGDRFAARTALGLAAGRPTIVAIRRLSRRMGLENLIDAMREVAAAIPDALLLIGGAGPLHSGFERQIINSGLGGNIKLLGRVSDEELPLYYRAADISIVPSVALEGFGLTTVESLACGTPVLVTPVGGLPEVVSGLSPRMVLHGKEPAALAEGLISFFRNELPLPDADACASYARSTFAWPRIARRVADFYRSALDRAAHHLADG